MQKNTSPLTTIQQRYSCRNYASTPIAEDLRESLSNSIAQLSPGPFQNPSRFELVAASEKDRDALRGLGTYGFIKNAPAFIIGAAEDGPLAMEDFGYRMERIILSATNLGLGTCWLGGTFTRSSFAQKISAHKNEIIPAVCSVGHPAQDDHVLGSTVRQLAGSIDRLPWETLFFDNEFGKPLSPDIVGTFATPLEMVRLAPSASNKQPWRILRSGNCWHFYLQRTKGYREMAINRFTGIADMQRIDMGIAMSHFELASLELGIAGKWEINKPDIALPDNLTSYVVSWLSER
jgi:nitroreductase